MVLSGAVDVASRRGRCPTSEMRPGTVGKPSRALCIPYYMSTSLLHNSIPTPVVCLSYSQTQSVIEPCGHFTLIKTLLMTARSCIYHTRAQLSVTYQKCCAIHMLQLDIMIQNVNLKTTLAIGTVHKHSSFYRN